MSFWITVTLSKMFPPTTITRATTTTGTITDLTAVAAGKKKTAAADLNTVDVPLGYSLRTGLH